MPTIFFQGKFLRVDSNHTIWKCKRIAEQNTFEILLLNNATMIGEHWETRMKMPNMCPFEKRHCLTWIDLYPGFGRNWDIFLEKFTNGTFKTLQMKIFGISNSMQGIKSAKLEIANFGTFWSPAWNLESFVSIYLHLKYFECAISKLFKNVFLPNPGFRSVQVKTCLF